MSKWKVIYKDEEQAEEYALYLVSCDQEGSEILNLSNPGDYDEDEYEEPEYELIEIDE